MFFWTSLAFFIIQCMLAIWSLVPCSYSFSKPSLDIWKFLVCIMLKPSRQDFKHDLTRMGDECESLMVSTFFGTTLLGNWDKDWPFPVLWPLLGLSGLLIYWKQYFDSIMFKGLNSSRGILSYLLPLLTAVLPKTHLISHSRMSGSGWLTTPLRLSQSLRSFLHYSSVNFFHLFLISSASSRSLHFCPLLSHLWAKCPLNISSFP